MLKRNILAMVLLLAALLAALPCYAEGEMVVTVTSTADSGAGSLRDAVNDVAPNGVILFDDSLNKARINLQSFLLIDKPVTIEASNLADGVTIVGSGESVIKISGAEKSILVILMNLRISGQAKGEILHVSGATLNMGNCQIIGNKSGRGITATNTAITMTSCTIGGNGPAENGGGIYAGDKAKITMEKCSVASNSANNDGGGVFVAKDSEVILNECAINKNTANVHGGGMRIDGKLTVDKSSITENRAGHGGGYANFGRIEVKNSLIAQNIASGHGGGSREVGEAVLFNSIIAGNSAQEGGGMMSGGDDHRNSSIKINGCSISGNFAHNGNYGGVWLYAGNAQVKNSTIAKNSSGVSVQGLMQNIQIEYCTIVNNKSCGIMGGGAKGISLKRSILVGNEYSDIYSSNITMDSTYNILGKTNPNVPQNAAKMNAPKEKVLGEPVRHETLLCADGSGERVPLYYPLVAAQNNEFTAIDIIPAGEYEFELDEATDQLGKPRPIAFFGEEKHGDAGAIEMQK